MFIELHAQVISGSKCVTKPLLINVNRVESFDATAMSDKERRHGLALKTAVCFTGGADNMVRVKETLDEIKEMLPKEEKR
jgi:hypothetical protein